MVPGRDVTLTLRSAADAQRESAAHSDKRDAERIQILGEFHGEVMVFQPMSIKEISRKGAQVETRFRCT